MDIANLKIGTNTYAIKDTNARTSANTANTVATSAEAKADQAILDSATAQSTANTANTNAQNANAKIDGANIVGTYTSGTETLEISLELGQI